MAYESKPNQCGLFTNDNGKSDHSGNIDVVCGHCGRETKFWVNGYNKVARSGVHFINLVLKMKRQVTGEGGQGGGDDIPF